MERFIEFEAASDASDAKAGAGQRDRMAELRRTAEEVEAMPAFMRTQSSAARAHRDMARRALASHIDRIELPNNLTSIANPPQPAEPLPVRTETEDLRHKSQGPSDDPAHIEAGKRIQQMYSPGGEDYRR